MSYFAIESEGRYRDHVVIADENGNVVFENYLDLTYDEMKYQTDLEDFVLAVMDAMGDDGDQIAVTLVGEDDIFIWSIIIGMVDDEIRYNMVDWKADGKNYRYEPS